MASDYNVTILHTIRYILVLLYQAAIILINYLFGVSVTAEEINNVVDIEKRKYTHATKQIKHCVDILDIANQSGYIVREHVVTTEDGYLLLVHKMEKPNRPKVSHKGVVYFHHGLLTNSEIFVTGSLKEKNLPYLLVDKGYEVWLGNNRGNKYSRKHLKLSASDPQFWDFSLDEYAFYDIPAILGYISSFYNDKHKITYIGFSQGCSQLLASLSLKPELNEKLNHFIGLSPAVIPRKLAHPIFKLIAEQSANSNKFLYSLLGTRAIVPSVTFWSSLLGENLYEKIVDTSLVYLFGWSGKNISKNQKEVGYPHLFSNSSVKSLIHWFQIIQAHRFQMFNETCSPGLTGLSTMTTRVSTKNHRVAPFPIQHHLDVPMTMFYGNSDLLVDIEKIKSLLLDQNEKMKEKLQIIECPGYEHMDTLWGNDVYNDVYCKIFDII